MRIKGIKKGDIILISSVVILVFIGFSLSLFLRKSGKTVTVKENNKTVYFGDISQDKTLKLTHNTLVVKDGKAYMECSDCKNQICVLTGKIEKSGESIVCLPNKVIVSIE